MELAEVAVSGPRGIEQTKLPLSYWEGPDRLLVLTASVLAATPLPRFITLIKIYSCNKTPTKKVCS